MHRHRPTWKQSQLTNSSVPAPGQSHRKCHFAFVLFDSIIHKANTTLFADRGSATINNLFIKCDKAFLNGFRMKIYPLAHSIHSFPCQRIGLFAFEVKANTCQLILIMEINFSFAFGYVNSRRGCSQPLFEHFWQWEWKMGCVESRMSLMEMGVSGALFYILLDGNVTIFNGRDGQRRSPHTHPDHPGNE